MQSFRDTFVQSKILIESHLATRFESPRSNVARFIRHAVWVLDFHMILRGCCLL